MHVLRARRFRRAAVLFAALAGVCAYTFTGSAGASASSGIALPHLAYPITNFLQYVDGKAGAANPKLSPVLVGWTNNQGGSVLVGPTATNGAALAAEWINQHADGIDGHPIKLVYCEIPNTPAEGTACGDTFAATKGLDAIGFGGLAVGASQVESVVSPKIPIFVGVSVNPGDLTNPNTFIFGGGSTQVSWPYGTFAHDVLHTKAVALLFPDSPGYTGPAQAVVQTLKAEGIKTTTVALDPNATDYVGALEAAGVTNDDIYVNGTVASCVEVAKALQQLKVPGDHVFSTPLCLAAAVKSSLGDYSKWYYSSAQDNLAAGRPEVQAYYKLLASYGQSASDQDPWYCTAFSEIMTAAQFMNSIAKQDGFAKLTPSAVATAAKEWRGPFILGQPDIDCGEYPNAPASCADQQAFYLYKGNGKFVLASVTSSNPTGFLGPPPSLQPKT
jgi:branched-chain amino acid transport system substrate-binding protein